MARSKITEIIREVCKLVVGILIINGLFLAFMYIAFLIPKERMQDNMGQALEVWQYERDSAKPLFYDDGFYLDSFSDMIWANIASQDTDNPFRTVVAMEYSSSGDNDPYNNLIEALYYEDTNIANYSRYWNLCAGFMRVAFCKLHLREIRVLFYLSTMILLGVLLNRIREKIGIKGVIPIFFGCLFCFISLHSVCFSFHGEILSTLVGSIVIAYFSDKEGYCKNQFVLFALIGACDFALGPFVTPMLSVGVCLLIHCMFYIREMNWKESWINVCANGISWLVGYGGTIICKSVLAKVVCGSQTASETATMWLGPEFGITDRFRIVFGNVKRYFAPASIKLVIFVVLLVALLTLTIKYSKKYSNCLLILAIGVLPIIWMLIVARHSQHSFASNALCVTMMAVLYVVTSAIEWDRLKEHKTEGNCIEK